MTEHVIIIYMIVLSVKWFFIIFHDENESERFWGNPHAVNPDDNE